jgi:hypothetical protein
MQVKRSERNTTVPPMESICQLSARGVSLLHDGMYRDATVRQATECLEARLVMMPNGHIGSDGCVDSSDTMRHVYEEIYLHAVPMHGNITTLEHSFSPENSFALYDKTIRP